MWENDVIPSNDKNKNNDIVKRKKKSGSLRLLFRLVTFTQNKTEVVTIACIGALC